MAYFKINNIDFSSFVNELSVTQNHNYNAQTNAAGDTVIDFINSKRVIDVGIIPLDGAEMAKLLNELNKFNVSVSYREPRTNTLVEGVNCIIPTNNIQYYTIQSNKVLYNAVSLQFVEL